ncbi:MAG: hypothetical protein KDD61_08060 [Bdellovibrionales bacterium]|nr:hypothetical protein [Bdellovibrionales bacterium]
MRAIIVAVVGLLGLSAVAQNKINPDISLNALFTLRGGTEGNKAQSEVQNGFALQEAELRLTSNIDVYFRGDIILAVENEKGQYSVAPEEAFVETLKLPSMTVRVGKFYPYWGRSNQWHTHAFPFIDALQTREAMFGEEGFNETGLAISYLFPTSWYFEGVLQFFSAENSAVFASPGKDDGATVYFLKNLWDLTDSSTVELDLGFGEGQDVQSMSNKIYNAALTYKSKLAGQRQLLGTIEYSSSDRRYFEDEDNPGTYLSQDKLSVASAWLQYEFIKRWWSQIKYEVVSHPESNTIEDVKISSLLFGFVPSEFSAIRLQYDWIDDPSKSDPEQRVALQLNVTMGAHPAHDY